MGLNHNIFKSSPNMNALGAGASGAAVSFTPAELGNPANGDTVLLFLFSKTSTGLRVDTSVPCSAIKAPNASTLPTTDGPKQVFTKTTDGHPTDASSSRGGHTVIVLDHVWDGTEKQLDGTTDGISIATQNTNSPANSSSGSVAAVAGSALAVMPLGMEAPLLSNALNASVITHGVFTGQLAGAKYLRFVWGLPVTSTDTTVTWGSGPTATATTTIDNASGLTTKASRSTQATFIAGYVGTVPGDGTIAAEDATFTGPANLTQISGFTVVVASSAPFATQAPTISGSPVQGQQIVCDPNDIAWSGARPISFAYRWQKDTGGGTWVSTTGTGGTTDTYTPNAADVGLVLRCRVTGTNAVDSTGYQAFTASTSAVSGTGAPVPTGTPALEGNVNTGVAITGETVDVDLSGVSWTGSPTLVTQFMRSNTVAMDNPVNVGNVSTYTFVAGDVGKYFAFRQKDNATGVATGFSNVVKAVAPMTKTEIAVASALDDGNDHLIPGSSVVGYTFPAVAPSEAGSGLVDYLPIFVRNLSEIPAPFGIWIVTPTPSPDDEVDVAASSVAVNGVVPLPASRLTAPSISGTWGRPATRASWKDLGTIPAGGVKLAWLRRTVAAGADGFASNFVTIDVGANPIQPV